jgi:hypothetical protein
MALGAREKTSARQSRPQRKGNGYPRDHGDKGLRNGYSEMKTGTH